MGIFSNLFRKKEPEVKQSKGRPEIPIQDTPNIEITEIVEDNDKKIMAEYYDDNPDFKKFYDVTRLIIDRKPIEINGALIYSAKVSWYGQNDCIYLEEDGEDLERRNQMTDIRLQLNMPNLYTDPEYQNVLMTQLLDMKRVQRYMQMGMEEDAEQPCGNYIGNVDINPQNGNYVEGFRIDIGNVIHKSPEMVAKRQRYRAAQERARQKAKAEKQAQIAKLQKEIDEL